MAGAPKAAPAAASATSIDHVYASGHFKRADLYAIIQLHRAAVLASVYGSVERVEMAEALVKVFNDEKAWKAPASDPKVGPGDGEAVNAQNILIPEAQIAGWVHGVAQAWQTEPSDKYRISDTQRSSLLMSAKALKCSGRLLRKLPRIPEEDLKHIDPMDDDDTTMDP